MRTVAYDQYEVAVPVGTMAECMGALLDTVYEGDWEGANETATAIDKGFRTAPLIRCDGWIDR